MEVSGTRREIIDTLSCIICYNIFDLEEHKPIYCVNSHVFCVTCNEKLNHVILTSSSRDISKLDCCPVCRQKITENSKTNPIRQIPELRNLFYTYEEELVSKISRLKKIIRKKNKIINRLAKKNNNEEAEWKR